MSDDVKADTIALLTRMPRGIRRALKRRTAWRFGREVYADPQELQRFAATLGDALKILRRGFLIVLLLALSCVFLATTAAAQSDRTWILWLKVARNDGVPPKWIFVKAYPGGGSWYNYCQRQTIAYARKNYEESRDLPEWKEASLDGATVTAPWGYATFTCLPEGFEPPK